MAAKKAKKASKVSKKKSAGSKRKTKTKKTVSKTTVSKKSSSKDSSLNNILMVVLAIALIAVVVLYVNTNGDDNGTTSTTIPAGGEYGMAQLDFYVMSQCPYGTQVEDAIAPVLKSLGNSVNFTLNFIASENPDGSFNSLHGQPEVDGNIMQLCAIKYYPQEYMDFIVCQNENAQQIQTNWRSCAATVGLDASVLESCFTGGEGADLHSESLKLADAAQASGSPTIYLNGERYSGARDDLSFMRALCAQLDNHPECASIPECGSDNDCRAVADKDGKCMNPGEEDAKCEYNDPIPIDMIVIGSQDCASCDPERIVDVTRDLFKGVKITYVEYSSDEGQELFQKYNLKFIPAYLFDKNITESPNYGQVARALVQADDLYKIHPDAAGSTYNPSLVEIPNKLDLFVMSQCPYGTIAEKNTAPVLDLFGSQINFTLGFIATENEDGTFRSLHGQPEVDENIRQLCVIKDYPDVYMDYILCIAEGYSDAEGIWEDCARESSINIKSIKECAEGDEGKQLLSDNIVFADEVGAGSSPTFVVNGKETFVGALSPETIKEYLCTANPSLDGCETVLAGASPSAPVPAGAC